MPPEGRKADGPLSTIGGIHTPAFFRKASGREQRFAAQVQNCLRPGDHLPRLSA